MDGTSRPAPKGSIDTLPGGSLRVRVRVYADTDVLTGRPHYVGEVIKPGPHAAELAEEAKQRLVDEVQADRHVHFVHFVLYGAALISLAAQVATTAPSVWGWIMAALPAAGFLAVVKIVLSRTPIETRPDQNPIGETGPVRSLDQPDDDGRSNSPSTGPTQHGVGTALRSNRTKTRAGQAGESTSQEADRTGRKRAELLKLARTQAAHLQETEGKVTRDGLAAAIRKAGHSVSTDIASELLRLIQAEARPVGAG